MSLLKRTGSNMLWIALSDLITKGSVIFVTIYLARVLGADNFGLFSLGVAIASTLWPIVDLGTSGYGTREIARDITTANKLLVTLNTMRIFASILVIAVSTLVLIQLDTPDQKFWIIMSALIYLTGFALCPDWVIRGMEDMPYLFIINLITSLFFIFGIGFLIHSPDDTIAASLVRSLSFMIGSIAGLIIIYKKRNLFFFFHINLSDWISQIKKTYIFLANRIVTNLGQFLPFFYISYALTDTDTGLFAAPHRLYIVGIAGLAAISSAIYPVLSDIYKNQPERFDSYQLKLVKYLLYTFIPFAFIGYFGASDLINILFGDEYIESAIPLGIMLATIPIVAMRSIYMFTLLSGGLEKYTFPAMVVAILIQAVTALICIPKWGISGSALAIFTGELTAFLILYYNSRKNMTIHNIVDFSTISLVMVSVILLVVATFGDWGLIASICFSVPLYLALTFYCNILSITKFKAFFSSRDA